jgi:hypothetical protein
MQLVWPRSPMLISLINASFVAVIGSQDLLIRAEGIHLDHMADTQ